MTDILTLRKFEALSPFEIKDELIKLAKKTSRTSQSAFLNAGRGNPNWVATTPREGFFLLGQFAITESKRVMDHPAGIGGMPQDNGIAARFETWLADARRYARCGVPFGHACSSRSRRSSSSRMRSSTSSSIRSSVTTIRCRTECSFTTSGSCTNI